MSFVYRPPRRFSVLKSNLLNSGLAGLTLLSAMVAASTVIAAPAPKAAAVPAAPKYQAPANAKAIAGSFELLGSNKKQCKIMLRNIVSPHGKGMMLGVPAGCRKAFPIAKDMMLWHIAPQTGAIELQDRQNNILLNFAETTGEITLVAKSDKGDAFEMKPVDGKLRKLTPAIIPSTATNVMLPQGSNLPESVPASSAKLVANTVGTYDLLRVKSQDTGCRIMLGNAPSQREGALRATLLDNCGERGIKTFSPQSWYFEDNSLYLVGSKGQKLYFNTNRPGSWEKGAGQGEPLFLRKQ